MVGSWQETHREWTFEGEPNALQVGFDGMRVRYQSAAYIFVCEKVNGFLPFNLGGTTDFIFVIRPKRYL